MQPRCGAWVTTTMMNSASVSPSIAHAWPPAPGPDNTGVGWKQRFQRLEPGAGLLESLAGLHARNWWSGLRINAEVNNDIQFHCRIVAGPIVMSEWYQSAGVWTPLPMLVSADMGTTEDLCLKIMTPVCAQANVLISFHELE